MNGKCVIESTCSVKSVKLFQAWIAKAMAIEGQHEKIFVVQCMYIKQGPITHLYCKKRFTLYNAFKEQKVF